jgi:uncharacterized protein (TIGR02757 family)
MPPRSKSSPENPGRSDADPAFAAHDADDPHARLGPFLDALLEDIDYLERREADPIGLVHRFEDDRDREVAALIASSLAYGRVSLLRQAIGEVFDVLGDRPARLLQDVAPGQLSEPLDGFVYRMSRGPDLVDLLWAIGEALRQYDTLEALYASGDGSHLQRASHLVQFLRGARLRAPLTRGFRYLLPDPADGSATKRLHMFFRWMVRGPDTIDFGIWDAATPDELVIPLDTHTSRLCRYLGLTQRKTANLRTAIEVTDALRAIDPDDPLRYDFALAHLGISGRCVHRRSPEHCPGCPIELVCQL